MSNIHAALQERLKKGEQSPKMAAMAKQSASGQLTNFSGMFSLAELTPNEKNALETLLRQYAKEDQEILRDLDVLIAITSEVKAINNQAALLHGERIKRAHGILTKYRDGAFTAWLISTYGNRQTPYNLMQYYEFYEALPKPLRPQIEIMPRQAVYTLASREGALEKKLEIVEGFKGQTKMELLQMIREAFPLALNDKRSENIGEQALLSLKKISAALKRKQAVLSKQQKQILIEMLQKIQDQILSSGK